MYVVSCLPLVQCIELVASALSSRLTSVLFVTVLGSRSVCSHQVLVGQPTNKKSVSIPPPSPHPFFVTERIEVNSLLALLLKWWVGGALTTVVSAGGTVRG